MKHVIAVGLLVLAAAASAAPEPPHVVVALRPHGNLRAATVSGSVAGSATRVYSIASGGAHTLVVRLQTRSAGPTQFVIEPDDGGAILYESRFSGLAARLPVDADSHYQIRVFNVGRSARARSAYSLQIELR